MRYFLVEHPAWSFAQKIEVGPNSNAEDPRLKDVANLRVETIGSSPQCRLVLPDKSIPDIYAIVAHGRNQRGYVVKLPPEFHEQKAMLERAAVSDGWRCRIFEWEFDVAGYTILGMCEEGEDEPKRVFYPWTDLQSFECLTYEERMARDRRYNKNIHYKP